jgi:tetratricopeptide (TPR) repeat protein
MQAALLGLVALALGSGPPDAAPRAPLPPPGFMEAVLKLIEEDRTADARELLEPLVANHPAWPRAHLYLALTYHRENRYDPARELFERTLVLDPQYTIVRYYYAWCLYYLGRLGEARENFTTFLAAKPGNADAIFGLALIDYDEDKIDSARARLLEAIRIASEGQDAATEAKARARLADVHVRTGELAQARSELERSIELNPRNYETYYKLSRVLERLGDTAGAEQARQKHREVRERIRPGSSATARPVERP